jgi:Sugar (and other) transporter
LLIISSSAMGLMLIALGVYFYLLDAESDAVNSLNWLPLTSLCVYLVAFSIGFGPLPWLIMSEVYSKECNAIAGPITGSFAWIFAFTITSTFGFISDAIGMGPTFWMFAGLTFLGLFFTMFVVIETKAKSMAEIQRILGGEKIIN